MIKLTYTRANMLASFRDVLSFEVETKSEFSISFYEKGVEVLTLSPKYEEDYDVLDSIEKFLHMTNFDYCEVIFTRLDNAGGKA